jgi:phage shock protein C
MEEPAMSRKCKHKHGCRHWRRARVSISDRRLYRDPDRGRLAGVCAGLADYFRTSTTMIRFAAITALIFIPQVTVIAYLLAALLLPTREDIAAASDQEPETDPDFARERARQRAFDRELEDRDARESLDDRRRIVRQARERLERIETRIQGMEAYVTSRRFDLDREFGQL